MTAVVIDGKLVADGIRAQVKASVADRISKGLSVPGLATVLVGDDPASQAYVRSKHKACQELGINSYAHTLPADSSQVDVEKLVSQLNQDPSIHGILVQLPLPKGLDEEKVLSAISLSKDVDGFHPINIGHLAQKGREPLFVPCTPAGVMVLLEKSGVKFAGAKAVVLGRSNIVGMPVSLLLLKANATVTICHSRTANLAQEIQKADILVAAIGQPNMVKGDWVKPGAVVIDVGINRADDPSNKRGYHLVGDVDYDEVSQVAGAITPVPGGVGPMTIAMLMRSTLHAAELADKQTL